MVNLTINQIPVSVKEGTTILDAARSIGIDIPTLCYLRDINEIGACRVCVVEVEGLDRCISACNNAVSEGMVVYTNSKKVRHTRKTNVQLILSQHNFRCATCVRNENCQLQKVARELNIYEIPYKMELESKPWNPNSPLIRDAEKCVRCMRCVQVCDKVQNMNVWDVVNTGSHTTVAVRENKNFEDINCTLCGQCITKCPVGALTARDDISKVIDALEDPDKVTVIQVAPAVRAAWGEDMGISPEIATEKRMAGALKKVGFNYVFDTVFTADLTIMEEGSEFLGRLPEIKESGLPMFTSCCPGWVHFMRSEYPQLLGRLSSAKSPQQMFGAVTKTYFAEKIGVPRENIFSISIMPCTAKKKEATWKNCGDDVDVVLTTREMNRLLRSRFINAEMVEEAEFDSPLGTGTGAGVIFGATGGVMEAALRSAYYLVTNKNPDADAFKGVRGLDGWKEAEFDVAGTPVKVAVASGLGNTRKLVEAILKGEVKYDFVEIMACPGGCINGGGQPISDCGADLEQRSGVLYGLDANNAVRFSHENKEVATMYEEYFEKPLSHKSHELLHIDQINYK